MENKNRIVTVTFAQVFDTKHNLVAFDVEGSIDNPVVCRESDRCKVINAKNLVEHESVEAAQAYVKAQKIN